MVAADAVVGGHSSGSYCAAHRTHRAPVIGYGPTGSGAAPPAKV